jgi:hypothetical protein
MLLCIGWVSCTTNTSESQTSSFYLEESVHPDSIITLKGILNINSKGAFLFKGINYANEGRGSASYLIPYDNDLKNYVQSHYDAHLHLRNLDEPFFVLIEGKYLTDNLINSEDSTSFLFNFVALLDESELIDKKDSLTTLLTQ